jgi:hypothetical protein
MFQPPVDSELRYDVPVYFQIIVYHVLLIEIQTFYGAGTRTSVMSMVLA